MLDEYWDEENTPFSNASEFWPQWLFQYNNKLPLCENIEIAYLIWKSEQHILTPKYAILRSFAPLVKYQHISEDDDGDKPLEITCQSCKRICKIFWKK